jgi:hypothetical protein
MLFERPARALLAPAVDRICLAARARRDPCLVFVTVFFLLVGVAGAYPAATIDEVTQTSLRVGNLDCGTQYEIRLREWRSGAYRDQLTYTRTTAACPQLPPPPTAEFSISPAPAVRLSPTSFTSTGTCAHAPCAYRWFHGDATGTEQIGTGTTASFTYTGPAGTRTVTLKVTDAANREAVRTRSFEVVEPNSPPPPSPPPPTTSYPDASNTGVPPGTVLTPSGGITINTAGTVIDGRDISGPVVVNAPNVTIRRSRIRASAFNIIDSNSTGLLIEDVEIDGGGTGASHNAIWMQNVTVRRANIHGTENGGNVATVGNVTVEDSWIHDLTTCCDAHTDGLQFNEGAHDVVVRHNTIDPTPLTDGATACIIMWDGGGTQNARVRIEDNRLLGQGTAWALYSPRQAAQDIYINRNRFQRGVFGTTNGVRVGTTVTEFNGNVYDDTGQPVSPG